MALANLSLSSTFTEHIIRTNQTVKVINDIENLTHPLANIAGVAANTANSVANSAANIAFEYITSNTIFLARVTDSTNNLINTYFTDIYSDSNASFLRSNAALLNSNLAYDVANASFAHANSFVANTANIVADYVLANSNVTNVINATVIAYMSNVNYAGIYVTANSAFIRANTANLTANMAYANALFANSTVSASYAAINSAYGTINTAFGVANNSRTHANSAFNTANLAFDLANNAASSELLNAAFEQANVSFIFANVAYDFAGVAQNTAIAAYQTANTPAITITNEINSNLSTYYPTLIRTTGGSINQMNVSSTKLYFRPSTGELTSTSFNSLSDENVKKNISKIENALSLIEKLNGVSFEWKGNNEKSSGVIAQNLINVVPYLVNQSHNESMTVNYDGLSALFIEAIKELNKEIKDIKQHLGI